MALHNSLCKKLLFCCGVVLCAQSAYALDPYEDVRGFIYYEDSKDSNEINLFGNYKITESHFGLGAGYEVQSIGPNHSANVLFSYQWVFNDSWFFEPLVALGYLAPNARYFEASYNNIGDGINFELGALYGHYVVKDIWGGFRAALKAGVSYTFSYMWASKNKLVNTTITPENSRAMYNALGFKVGVEASYKEYNVGMLLTYYLPNAESLKETTISAVTQSNATLFNSIGFSVYYLYRF